MMEELSPNFRLRGRERETDRDGANKRKREKGEEKRTEKTKETKMRRKLLTEKNEKNQYVRLDRTLQTAVSRLRAPLGLEAGADALASRAQETSPG